MNLVNLDAATRERMKDEIERDVAQDNLYLSPRLSDTGRAKYSGILIEAALHGTAETLTADLQAGCMQPSEVVNRRGRPTVQAMRRDAAAMLAEGEFNRFYIRGLCRRALDDGITAVVVYRAKAVANPRPESEALIGQYVDAAELLEDIRSSGGALTVLGVPAGPGSGISVRLPDQPRE